MTKNALLNREELLVPERSRLLQNYPNPFNPETWIPFQLADPATVLLSIYDVSGSIVRTLELGERPAGVYISKDRAVHWDGRNNEGEKVSSGVYFYHLRRRRATSSQKRTTSSGDFSASRRMIILK